MAFKRNTNKSMAPVSQSVTVGSNATQTHCRVVKRDYVCSVTGSNDFTVVLIDGALSPTNSNVFSWLYNVARSFDYISWNKVKIEFVSSSPSSYAGRVYICADYDPSDLPPTSPAQLMSQQDAVSGGVWNSFSLNLSQRELKRFRRYFTKRSSVTPEPADSMPGKFFIATDGAPTSKIGDIYIEYDVDLTVPSIDSEAIQDRLTLEYVNPVQDPALHSPTFGIGATLSNPKIKSLTDSPPIKLATTYNGLPGFELLPIKQKLLLQAASLAMRSFTGSPYWSAVFDVFQNVAGGNPTNPTTIGDASRWKGVEYVIDDPDATGALTLTQSPLNKSESPIISTYKGVQGNHWFNNDVFLNYDPDLVAANKRPPRFSVKPYVPQLYADTSLFGLTAGTNGANAPAVMQDTFADISAATAIGLSKVIIDVFKYAL